MYSNSLNNDKKQQNSQRSSNKNESLTSYMYINNKCEERSLNKINQN
jgi:hypothetical protein